MSDLPEAVRPPDSPLADLDPSELGTEGDRDTRAWVRGALEQLGPFLFVLVLGAFLTIVSPYFLTSTNISAIFVQMSVIAVITVGETMVIITAGIDLSVSTVVALSGVISSMLVTNDGMGVVPGMIVGVLVGGGVGLVNGLLITAVRLPPFIATLGTLSAVGGVALLVTNGQPIAAPTSFDVLGDGHIGPIPVPIVLMVVVAAVGWFVLSRTTLGRSAYAIGSNYETARLSGIRVNRVLTSVYVIQGLLAGLGGVIVASRVVTGDPSAGTNYNLDAIAAAVIGGASLFGGEGTVIGGLIGALLMELISNGSDLLNISNFWQDVILGVVIIAAVAYDQFRRRRLPSSH
ncbi:MAG: ABC transporter permease [Solirubrobacteraceae bacterium]